ncbi:UDP-glucose 4-epimerase GalE [Ideonella margarita]|uniref:UDP-glucose 4-epimerase n=1 Tax=Ideonella margarita TaxID=2984191 RepID=A0ABU9BZJ0_9BURK
MATVLLTGATGYIGSHTWLSLLAAGFQVVGVDDFSNSSPEVLKRLEALSGQQPDFVQLNVCDPVAMDALFAARRIDAVVHFAAFKAVGESTAKPLEYFQNNLGGLLNTCQAMRRHGVKRIVFSSSATVYGQPDVLPIREDARTSTTNPYGATKLMGEQMLEALAASDAEWQIACLRYFNPVGAHESGQIGEDPSGIPNNLMPYVAQVAVGRRARLQVFGSDYDTADGTGVRDYIHVVDLADGHVAALTALLRGEPSFTVNLGTGQGYSVLDVVAAYERASGRPVPYDLVPRRPGDVAACYADPATAKAKLGWVATRGLDQMCADSWRWQQQNPNGFGQPAA